MSIQANPGVLRRNSGCFRPLRSGDAILGIGPSSPSFTSFMTAHPLILVPTLAAQDHTSTPFPRYCNNLICFVRCCLISMTRTTCFVFRGFLRSPGGPASEKLDQAVVVVGCRSIGGKEIIPSLFCHRWVLGSFVLVFLVGSSDPRSCWAGIEGASRSGKNVR